MRRRACLLGVVLAAGLSGGCVERKFVVETDPPNALVLINNDRMGSSPAYGSFVYYGKYNVTIQAPGYETLHAQETLTPPWYEWWPLDFFFETLWPFELEDNHAFRYRLVPTQIPNTEDVLRRSTEVREQGRAIRPAPTPPPEVPATQTTAAPPQGADAPPAQMPPEGER
jgi:hypothetical protein